jgi:uncharacterized membrane protein YfcA
MSEALPLFLAGLAFAGLFAGFVGGLFGVGGGVVLVPALYVVFGALGIDDSVRVHLAVGTSLSTIFATSLRSLAAHARAQAVDFALLRAWVPWIALGAIAGAAIAGAIEARALSIVFGAGLLLAAAQLGFGDPNWRAAPAPPERFARAAFAFSIGTLSAMMGVGGGVFGVTLLTACGRPIHQAVATASGFGAAIAAPAALGFVLSGWGREGLPWGSAGFVNLPGFVVLASLTVVTAPIGARLAHRLDQKVLKRAFALFLAVTALLMLREALIR